MVAYSFQKQFAMPILEGTKGGTIRADRKRHARPREELQLYTGMRTRHCKLIARKTCLAANRLTLDFRKEEIHINQMGEMLRVHHPHALNAFAVFDGFKDWDGLRDFWLITHDTPRFKGVHILWLPLPVTVWSAYR